MKRTPRVVIPPPHTEVPKKHCVQEGTACPSAQSTHSEKAVFSAETTPRGVVPTQPQRSEGSDTTPTQKCRKNAKREFNHLPQQGSRRNPAKRFRWEEDERQRERVLPLAAGRGIRRPLGRRPASHLSGLRRSRCPAKCTGRGMAPHPQAAGRSPHPLKAASVSAETLLPASGGAASKGDQSPFEEPPALRGDERNHFRKVTDYEKRYQIQHAHGIHRP